MRILIIDDNRELRHLLGHALAQFGWESAQAEDGVAALAVYATRHSEMDAILLDYIMPDMDGMQLLPKLLAINPAVPILMLTSHGSIPLVTAFMEQGGSGFVEKPVTHFEILRLRIEEAIQQARRRRDLEAIRAAQQATARLNQEKDLFLANMSHELRTPLTAILQFATLAKRRWMEERPAEAMAMLDGLLAGKDRLLRFVSNMECLARLHTGQWCCQPIPNDLMALVQNVVHTLKRGVDANPLRWCITGGSVVPACFDAQSVRIILTELLDNARQFSPPDGVVEIGVIGEGAQVRITIADSGPGIPAGEEEAIFSPFTESSRTRSNAGGTGLGLAIARGLAQWQGGRVSAANRAEGSGAVFTLVLPV